MFTIKASFDVFMDLHLSSEAFIAMKIFSNSLFAFSFVHVDNRWWENNNIRIKYVTACTFVSCEFFLLHANWKHFQHLSAFVRFIGGKFYYWIIVFLDLTVISYSNCTSNYSKLTFPFHS
jgi:hypothetical protein